ncbi:hypothetical protein ACFQER_04670 [Halomicroarcula sp. GCM10025894]
MWVALVVVGALLVATAPPSPNYLSVLMPPIGGVLILAGSGLAAYRRQ